MNPFDLENVKVGDELINSNTSGRRSLVKIARVTKSQVITESGGRYWKKDGRLVGTSDSWNYDSLRIPRDHEERQSVENEMRKRIALSQLRRIESLANRLPLETLEAIVELGKDVLQVETTNN